MSSQKTCSRTYLAADACWHAWWAADFKSFSIDSCLNDVQPGKLEKTFSSHGERGKLSAQLAEKIVGIFTMQTRISTSSQFFSLFALGRKGVADFPPLAYARNRKWTDSSFLWSLCSTTALFVRRSQEENRVLDLVFARKRTDWQPNGRSWAVLWMIDVFKRLPKKKKKGTTVFEGGGGDGEGGRVRVCQVNATRITRKVFKILNFVFGNLSFAHGTERKTGVAKLDPCSKI